MDKTIMKKTFGEWLLAYKGKNPVIQDLRDDYQTDFNSNFKRKNKPHIKTADLMMWHIGLSFGSCKEASDACKEAAVLYGETLKGWD
jgi:hypothetical protein